MKLQHIALATGLLPILGGNISYLIAVYLDHLPSCIPYLEGCTSISSAGRKAPESMVFRATMIPASVLLVIFWQLSVQWLKKLGSPTNRTITSMQVLGTAAAVFLIIYTLALGFIDPVYHLQRRIGVTGFFFCMFLSQLLLIKEERVVNAHYVNFPLALVRMHLTIATIVLILGLALPIVGVFFGGRSDWENIIEWNFALLMNLYFVVSYWIWKDTGFSAEFTIKLKSPRH